VIAASSKNPDQAFDWMVYRSSKDAWEDTYAGDIILAYSDGPTRQSIFSSPAFIEPLSGVDVKMIEEGYKFTIPNPYTPRSPQANRVVNTILPTEVDNMLRGAKTPEQAAADMCAQLDEILRSA
jgi:ABC-type glycerol-3-phosphate transport system substrate-binding protein